jgi:hypothetical protein
LWQPAVAVVFSHNPTTSCHGDNYRADVTVGPNTTGAVRTIGFKLVVRNATSASTQSLYVSIAPKATAPAPPGSNAAGPPGVTALAPGAPVSAVDSSNWSGYAAYGGPFTAITGTFDVPSLNAQAAATVTSEWVGVDGARNSSLVQAGVLEQATAGGAGVEIYPWWEILPATETPITTVNVPPGDSVTIDIYEVASGTWEISLVDNTNGQSFSTKQAYSGPGQSAEWIVEAPTSGRDNQVADLGPFTPSVSFTGLGTDGPVASLEVDTMVQGGVQVATPSGLTKSGFSVAYTAAPLSFGPG